MLRAHFRAFREGLIKIIKNHLVSISHSQHTTCSRFYVFQIYLRLNLHSSSNLETTKYILSIPSVSWVLTICIYLSLLLIIHKTKYHPTKQSVSSILFMLRQNISHINSVNGNCFIFSMRNLITVEIQIPPLSVVTTRVYEQLNLRKTKQFFLHTLLYDISFVLYLFLYHATIPRIGIIVDVQTNARK